MILLASLSICYCLFSHGLVVTFAGSLRKQPCKPHPITAIRMLCGDPAILSFKAIIERYVYLKYRSHADDGSGQIRPKKNLDLVTRYASRGLRTQHLKGEAGEVSICIHAKARSMFTMLLTALSDSQTHFELEPSKCMERYLGLFSTPTFPLQIHGVGTESKSLTRLVMHDSIL
jgi:hypothetical protein